MTRRDFVRQTLTGIGCTVAGSAQSLVAGSTTAAAVKGKGIEPHLPGYARMFPAPKARAFMAGDATEKGLRLLGQAMEDKDSPEERENDPDLPPAGYTYLGQFIGHDLSLDATTAEAAIAEVERIQNLRTPYLDLDQIYGGGPSLSPFLYENCPEDRGRERFLIGQTLAAGGESSSADDLPRNLEGIALSADARDDENLIVAQLHVALLKLHNSILSQPNELKRYRNKGDSDFTAAQRAARWHYQWMVRNDYLPTVLDPVVINLLPELEKQKRAAGPGLFQIPVEFNSAVFRFGHSMVRSEYKGLNAGKKQVRLSTLLGLTGPKGLTPPGERRHSTLPADWVVCWDRFFETPPRTSVVNRAQRIDTQIASALYHLDEQDVKHFASGTGVAAVEARLPVRTLLRGLRMNLPSGEAVACALTRPLKGIKLMTENEVVGGAHEKILTDPRYGLRGNTPLWYYILKEAEVSQHKGRCLGPVGSYIIAFVIIGALLADRDSYLWGPDFVNWRPTLAGGVSDTMSKLLRFVAPEANSSPRCDPVA